MTANRLFSIGLALMGICAIIYGLSQFSQLIGFSANMTPQVLLIFFMAGLPPLILIIGGILVIRFRTPLANRLFPDESGERAEGEPGEPIDWLPFALMLLGVALIAWKTPSTLGILAGYFLHAWYVRIIGGIPAGEGVSDSTPLVMLVHAVLYLAIGFLLVTRSRLVAGHLRRWEKR